MARPIHNSVTEAETYIRSIISEVKERFKIDPESPSGVSGAATGRPKGSLQASGNQNYAITVKGHTMPSTHVVIMLDDPELYVAMYLFNYQTTGTKVLIGRKDKSLPNMNNRDNLVLCGLDTLNSYLSGALTESELNAMCFSVDSQPEPEEDTKMDDFLFNQKLKQTLQGMTAKQLTEFLSGVGFNITVNGINANHPIFN